MYFESLRDISLVSIVLRLSVAILVGGVIGYNRGMKNRTAGFKTHILVAVGAAMAMLTNQYVYQYIDQTVDMSRFGAQVVNGIGFLGCGTILVTSKHKVRGLTTAASLWTVAILGLAAGAGFFEGAILGGFFILCILTIFSKFDKYATSRSKYLDLYVELENPKILSRFILHLKDDNFKIVYVDANHEEYVHASGLACFLTIEAPHRGQHSEIINTLLEFEGVNYIEEI